MKYEEPFLEMLYLEADVITASVPLDPGGNSGEDVGDWGVWGL